VLASTPLDEGDYIAHGLWGHELAARLADSDRDEDFFVMDVRSRAFSAKRASLNDPADKAYILQRMLRLRDPKGIYQEGGCIDTSREYPRCIHPATADIRLPERSVGRWEKFLRLLRARTRLKLAICVSLPLLAPSHHAAAAHSLSEEIREVCHVEQFVRVETDLAAYLGIHSR